MECWGSSLTLTYALLTLAYGVLKSGRPFVTLNGRLQTKRQDGIYALGFPAPTVCLRPRRCQQRLHGAKTGDTTPWLNRYLLATFSSTIHDLVSQ